MAHGDHRWPRIPAKACGRYLTHLAADSRVLFQHHHALPRRRQPNRRAQPADTGTDDDNR